VAGGLDRKQELLEAELRRYFGETCPALVARWQAAITGLAAPFLREPVVGCRSWTRSRRR